jgi:hypothetical protein
LRRGRSNSNASVDIGEHASDDDNDDGGGGGGSSQKKLRRGRSNSNASIDIGDHTSDDDDDREEDEKKGDKEEEAKAAPTRQLRGRRSSSERKPPKSKREEVDSAIRYPKRERVARCTLFSPDWVPDQKRGGVESWRSSARSALWRTEGHKWVGQEVRRIFPKSGVVDATVVGWQSADEEDNSPPLWHILHPDGDEEDLEEYEMDEALELMRQHRQLELEPDTKYMYRRVLMVYEGGHFSWGTVTGSKKVDGEEMFHIVNDDQSTDQVDKEQLLNWVQLADGAKDYQDEHEWVGRRVKRNFNGKIMDGTIVGFGALTRTEPELWHVIHDQDQDEEDLEEYEAVEALQLAGNEDLHLNDYYGGDDDGDDGDDDDDDEIRPRRTSKRIKSMADTACGGGGSGGGGGSRVHRSGNRSGQQILKDNQNRIHASRGTSRGAGRNTRGSSRGGSGGGRSSKGGGRYDAYSPRGKSRSKSRRSRRRHFDSSSESSSESGGDSSDEDTRFHKAERKRQVRQLNAIQPVNINGEKLSDRDLKRADAAPVALDSKVNWSSVGGLAGHVQTLKEMVLLPLMYPELFERLHVEPPRGVLFFGPPGTGKTLCARALANSCANGAHGQRVAFFMRKGADCLSKWVGEAERQLRLLFDQAKRQQPSIIFFDEIDGLAPVRSSKQDQIHASIVSTLLALMDGLDSRGQVVVIGATNRIDAIDPALRRYSYTRLYTLYTHYTLTMHTIHTVLIIHTVLYTIHTLYSPYTHCTHHTHTVLTIHSSLIAGLVVSTASWALRYLRSTRGSRSWRCTRPNGQRSRNRKSPFWRSSPLSPGATAVRTSKRSARKRHCKQYVARTHKSTPPTRSWLSTLLMSAYRGSTLWAP